MDQPLEPPSYGESVGWTAPRPSHSAPYQSPQQAAYPAGGSSVQAAQQPWQPPASNYASPPSRTSTESGRVHEKQSSTSSFFARGRRHEDGGDAARREKELKDEVLRQKEAERLQKEREMEEQAERERNSNKHSQKVSAYNHLSSTSNSRIPADAQKALAPLAMTNANQPIEGTYAVELTNATRQVKNGPQSIVVAPTVNVNATGKNDVDLTLYFRLKHQPATSPRQKSYPTSRFSAKSEPGHGIPVEVLLRAVKGRLKLTIPERTYNRPLRIICNVEGGNATVSLPVAFDGKLAVWTPRGTTELADSLKTNSTIIPSTTTGNHVTVYRITPSADVPTIADVTESEGGGRRSDGVMMMDLCQINCAKGRVKVDYARAPRDANDGRCVIM